MIQGFRVGPWGLRTIERAAWLTALAFMFSEVTTVPEKPEGSSRVCEPFRFSPVPCKAQLSREG